ncbi:zinc-binding dehydrogenase [Acrocarpospora catenulata]|uniref:zinc-binding dehydrogenase n=1 Tax=Acrocarpospora catenulata TaxID=2836182 RepID=UPI001BDA8BA0|nr:zinc-binding dehydrogenase [Acrocarpospora catenulata]
MRAVWIHEFGDPDVLVVADTPEPSPGPGQVVVEVEFANLTFVETQVRAGTGPFRPALPTILGNGVGGVVASAGSGVDPGLVGRRVVTSTGGSGGYAERVAVAAAGLFTVPEGLALDAAVALLADGRTATLMLRAGAPAPGERVLVEAAAGGVGSLLVQLAVAAGARVIGAAGGDLKMAVAAELGAETVVDYRDPAWPELVRKAAGGVDVVLDGVGGAVAGAAFELLDPGGRMVSFGLASGEWAKIPPERAAERRVTLVRPSPTPEELRAATEQALAAGAAGRLRPLIGQMFPLEQAAEAHRAMAARGTLGKTLLRVRDS